MGLVFRSEDNVSLSFDAFVEEGELQLWESGQTKTWNLYCYFVENIFELIIFSRISLEA